ncbi:MAG: hypothetical protein HY716_07870 [Planctomycetes bacterium]|nr:hypothetical protein [Planctomycetota bacterium]
MPFVKPFLADLSFDDDLVAVAWWPLGKNREVVLDPSRSFGKPIVDSAAVPTAVLTHAVRAEGSLERVADWYEAPLEAVKGAVEFERKLIAA